MTDKSISSRDGGPAFPEKRMVSAVSGAHGEAIPVFEHAGGMSLRDWFAGQAVAALIARHRADVAWSDVAPRAYAIADAMLAERAKEAS